MINYLPYILCFILFLIGVYGILVKKNIIKIIISFGIMNYAINLFFILVGYKKDGVFPILSKRDPVPVQSMVDPLPQALVLTAIVIGLAVTILMIAIAIRLYEKYGTFDITQIRKLKG